jgi:hypothetical protein
MTVRTEGPRKGEFLVSEANGSLSREVVSFSAGTGTLEPGTVVSRLTADGRFAAYDNTGSDGTETAAGILYERVVLQAGATVDAVAVVRYAEVNAAELTGLDSGARADLAALGIVAR